MEFRDNISVIIPMFNSSGTIERTLNSIAVQSLEAIHIVFLVDDGSEDSTIRTVNKIKNNYDFQIRLLINPGKGVSAARNYGAKFVTTEWIAFLDSDDMWLPHKFQKSAVFLSNIDDVDMFGGRESNIQKHHKIKKMRPYHMFTKYEPVIQTTIVKTDVFKSVSGFNENMSYAEDLDFSVRVSAKFNVYLLPFRDFLTNPDKKRFGDSGLSKNSKLMQKGIESSLKRAFNQREITFYQYILLYIFNKIKYIRRIIIIYFRYI